MKKFFLVVLLLVLSVWVFAAERLPQWPSVRQQFLLTHHRCEVCGSESDLQVHHIVPFHIDSSKELDPENLITVCTSKRFGFNCHLRVAHGGNYKLENPWVVEDTIRIREKGNACKQQLPYCVEQDLKDIAKKVKKYNCEKYGKCSKKR